MPKRIEELKEIEEQMERVAHRLRHEEIRNLYCDKCEMTTPHERRKTIAIGGGEVGPMWECAVCWYVGEYLPAMED